MLQREVHSPERQEIELRAEYFEIYQKRRQKAATVSVWLVVTTLLALAAALLGGCDFHPRPSIGEKWHHKPDGSCVLVSYSGGTIDRVIPGLVCPDAGAR